MQQVVKPTVPHCMFMMQNHPWSVLQNEARFDQDIDVDIHYACKALNNLNILKLMRSLGAGLDAIGWEKLSWACRRILPDQILFTPNGVGIHEIKEAVAIGVQINIDNLETLEEFANEFGNTVPLCVPSIRIAGGNTKISVGTSTKFGSPSTKCATCIAL